MPNAPEDFWPANLEDATLRTPVTVLREQAALLGPKTQQLVVAEVASTSSSANFMHTFYLAVPTLDNYRYELFRIQHGILLYPVVGIYRSIQTQLSSEEHLKDWLKKVLTSNETVRLIQALLAQARKV
jgi:hypothetical protein